MARRALVEILADASGFIHGLNQSGRATQAFSADLGKLAVNARASAAAQVQASVRKTERLRTEVLAYKAVAASAVRGSQEQVAAANLAARAEGRLAGSMGVAAHEAARLRGHAGGLERDLGRATRGALAGSGVFRAFGRSLAFASGGFLAFASGGAFLRKSVDEARAAAVTQRQLAAQFHASGLSLKDYQGQIDQTMGRLSALSGITKDQLDQSFTTIFRGAGNVSKALKETALAADIAAGTHRGLAQVTVAVGKAAAGSTTALKRLGLEFPKHATAAEALAIAYRKFHGQAAAAATEQQKFGAVLHNSEVIIGTGILPTLNQYLAQGARWLQQMNQSGRLQHDVNVVMKDAKRLLHDLGAAAKFVQGIFHNLDRVTGSLENTLKDLAAVWLLLKARMAINWASTVTGIARTGTAAEVATGKLATLRASLLGLNGLAVAAVVTIIERKQIAKGLFHIPFAEDFAHYVDKKIPALGRLDRAAGVAPEQLDPNRYAPHAPPGYVPGTYGKRQSTPQNPGGFIAKSTVAPKGYQPGTYGQGQSTLENPGGFLPAPKHKAAAAQQAADPAAHTKTAAHAAANASKGFSLPFSLQLEEAKAAATAGNADNVRAARDQKAFLLKAVRRLHGQDLITAYGLLASANQVLAAAATAAAAKAKHAAKSVKTAGGAIGTYHHESSVAFTRGIHYASVMDRKLAEERYAQASAHRGFVPSGPAAQGQPVIVMHNPQFHGVHDIAKLHSQIKAVAKRDSRRGQR